MKYTDYKETREQGTFNFPIAYYHQTEASPRYLMAYHWHTQCELVYIISGTFTLTLNKDTHTYKEGDVIFISDGMLHGGTPNDCVYDCVVFDLRMLMQTNHVCAGTIKKIMDHEYSINTLISRDCPEIHELAGQLSLSLEERNRLHSPGSEFMIQGYLYHLIGLILENHLYSRSHITCRADHLEAIKSVLSYITENYNEDISLEELSRIAGMNPRYFCRYFRSMTDRTPIDYLNYYRIECACEKLRDNPSLSIRDIALACGFSDESYFIRTFKKYKATTPRQYILDGRFALAAEAGY